LILALFVCAYNRFSHQENVQTDRQTDSQTARQKVTHTHTEEKEEEEEEEEEEERERERERYCQTDNRWTFI
jgi:hypothetical protein